MFDHTVQGLTCGSHYIHSPLRLITTVDNRVNEPHGLPCQVIIGNFETLYTNVTLHTVSLFGLVRPKCGFGGFLLAGLLTGADALTFELTIDEYTDSENLVVVRAFFG